MVLGMILKAFFETMGQGVCLPGTVMFSILIYSAVVSPRVNDPKGKESVVGAQTSD
jgi:hypothetical protein